MNALIVDQRQFILWLNGRFCRRGWRIQSGCGNGASLMCLMDCNNIRIHISADFAGSAITAVVFNLLNPEDK